jgi:hypothetical protein
MYGLSGRIKTLNAMPLVNKVLKPCHCRDANATRGWNLLKNKFSFLDGKNSKG